MRALIIHGGRDNKSNRIYNDIKIFNLDNKEWIGVLLKGSV